MRAAARDDGALTEVGCSPPATAACKLKSNPGLRPGPQQTVGLMSMSRLSMTVIPVATMTAARHQHARKKIARG